MDYSKFSRHDLKVYAAYLINDEDILDSSSGGVATALSRYVINNGGVVAGVAYKEDFLGAEYIIADKTDDLEKLRGSKVIKADLNHVFSNILIELKKERKVLFFALPCVAAGLRKYLKYEYNNLIVCELICSGRTDTKVHIDFINYLREKYRSRITSFSVRAKKNAWLPEYTRATFENGKCYEFPFKNNEYGQAFKILKNEECIHCKFKGNNRFGDIMIGDFWGATKDDVFWNGCGVSVVFVETEKGLKFFEGVPKLIKYETNFEKAVSENLSVITPVIPHAEREKLMPLLKKEGLFKCMKQSDSMKKAHLSYIIDNNRLLKLVYKLLKKTI